MDEIARCCRVLGLEPGTSLEEIKSAYRDLVNVWHPDRFAHNERLRSKAEERLKEINHAYDYLIEHAAEVSTWKGPPESHESAKPAAAPDEQSQSVDLESETAGPSRNHFRNILFLVVGLVAIAGGILWWRGRQKTEVISTTRVADKSVPSSSATDVGAAEQPTNSVGRASTNIPAHSDSADSEAGSVNILDAMVPMNNVEVVKGAEGVTLTSKGQWWCYIETPKSVRPPLVVRTRAKTELNNIRLYYGIVGRVIFNWELNPAELRVHDPLTGRGTAVGGRGMVTTKEWHDIVWEIDTNAMKISVDGEVRFEGKGYYSGLNGFPGIGPVDSPVTVKSFAVESSHPSELANVLTSRLHPAGDILDSMAPMENGRVAKEADGIVITATDQAAPYLKSKETFTPPFVIRARAKTESRNLRIYCGEGFVILNWEVNPLEMRVRDPLSKRDAGVPGKGLIIPDTWHDIVWAVTKTGMSVSVDGQVRYQNRNDYQALNAWVGIGPAWSKVTVEYFAVNKQ